MQNQETVDTLALLRRRLTTFTKSEQIAARFILEDPSRVVVLPLRKLSQKSGVSEPTVFRLCRKLGFIGFQDFKMSVVSHLLGAQDSTRLGHDAASKTDRIAELSLQLCDTVKATLATANQETIVTVARKISDSSRITIAGLGGSAAVGHVLAESLTGLGVYATMVSDISHIQVLPQAIGSDDSVVGISHSGETEEITRFLSRCRKRGASTIAITNYEKSPLDLAAEISMYTAAPERYLGSYACEPRIAELALFEALLDQVSLHVKNSK